MPRSGPRPVRKYSNEFKLTAVQLSQRPGLQVKSVAAALTMGAFAVFADPVGNVFGLHEEPR